MGNIRDAIYESFWMEEDFAEEVLDSADASVEKEIVEEVEEPTEEPVEENLNESIWDMVKNDLVESVQVNESSDIGKAIDEYQNLLRKDIPPAEARAIVTGEKQEVKESLTESKEKKANKYDPKTYMKSVCERYRKEAKFSLDEELTEEKLKNEDWRIKNVAMKAAVPSAKLKEALLEGIKNED